MRFRDFLLNEMPITNFTLKGQWGPDAKRRYGYNAQDTGILENPKAVEKIHRSWSNSKNDFDLWFLRTPKAWKHIEKGEVDEKWIRDNLGDEEIKAKENVITVVFTNNTGAEKIPMTAWAMAHRLGHAIRRDPTFERYMTNEIEKDFNEILKYVYGVELSKDYAWGSSRSEYAKIEKYKKALYSAVGKMKSARENKILRSGEFTHELVAQYIITGKIEFNDLPESLIVDRKMAWGKPNYSTKRSTDEIARREYNDMLHYHAEKYEHNLDSIFSGLEGKIFVM